MRKRSIVTCIILTFVTCGIYGLVWLVNMQNDMVKLTDDTTSGTSVLLFSLITCGIYSLFWMYKTGDRLDQLRATNQEATGNQGILYLVLSILGLGIVSYALIQTELNRYAED